MAETNYPREPPATRDFMAFSRDRLAATLQEKRPANS